MFKTFCRSAAITLLAAISSSMMHAQVAANSTIKVDTVRVRFDDLVRTALTWNLRLQSIGAETRGIRSGALAVRSPYDPLLGAAAATNEQRYGAQVSGVTPTGASYAGSYTRTAFAGEQAKQNAFLASISQPILRGFGFASLRNTIHATDEAIASADARLSQARVDITATVGMLYAQLIESHQIEAVDSRSLGRAEELGAAYEELRRLDKITEVDLITAQLGVTSRRAELISARRVRQSAQDELVVAVYGSRSVARFPADDVVLMAADSVPTEEGTSLDDAIAKALAARPDVEAARRQVFEVRYLETVARNLQLPTLDLSVALSRSRIDGVSPLFGTLYNSLASPTKASFGLTLSRPLFNNAGNADRERAAAAVDLARVALADAENVVRLDVRSAYRDINVGRELVRFASAASELARRQYDGERARLDLGLTDIFRVLQVNDQVAKVEVNEAIARSSLATAQVRMRAAMGIGAQ
ncbi:MAG: TolC family protein [Gemmatimonadaceae bacterium]